MQNHQTSPAPAQLVLRAMDASNLNYDMVKEEDGETLILKPYVTLGFEGKFKVECRNIADELMFVDFFTTSKDLRAMNLRACIKDKLLRKDIRFRQKPFNIQLVEGQQYNEGDRDNSVIRGNRKLFSVKVFTKKSRKAKEKEKESARATVELARVILHQQLC